MRILYLGPESPVLHFLRNTEDEVTFTTLKKDKEFINSFDFVISYGYRHIIEVPEVPAINLHISYLPWNRGADPNFWSFFEDTPKGVTIHKIDSGIDTGDILLQERMLFSIGETLRSTYKKLHERMYKLFVNNWHRLRLGLITPKPQIGTSHRKKDKDKHLIGIEDKYLDMPIYKLMDYISDTAQSVEFWNEYRKEL